MKVLINIDVPDLDRAIRFYEQALGLTLRRKLFEESAAEMDGAAAPVFLLQKAEGGMAAADSPRTYRRHWTPVHLDFVVKDVASAVQRAVEAGAKLESGPQSFAWGTLATLSDPFGHGLCLIEWSGRGYDEVR